MVLHRHGYEPSPRMLKSPSKPEWAWQAEQAEQAEHRTPASRESPARSQWSAPEVQYRRRRRGCVVTVPVRFA